MEKITDKDIMQWLDAQRDAANAALAALGDGEEDHVERSPEGKAVRIINAIEAQLREMEAVEYLEARKELCNSQACKNCPLSTYNTKHCAHMEYRMPRRAVEIVKKWKEEQDGH